jgi:hypothetical protein
MRRFGHLWLLAAALLGAEETPRKVATRFRAIALESPLPTAAYREGKELRPLVIPSDFFSEEKSYRGDALLEFGLLEPTAEAKMLAETSSAIRARRAQAQAAEAAYEQAAQAAAALAARAPEGPAGDALRKRAEEMLAEAEPLADAARQARLAAEEAARQADVPPTTPDATRKSRPAASMTPLASCVLTEGDRQLLLFAVRDGKTEILSLPEPAAAHPYGRLRFLNLASIPLEVTDGRRTQALAPRSFLIWRPEPDAFGYVGLEIRRPGSKERPLRTLRSRPEADARTTYLIHVGADGRTTTVKGVTERAPRVGP